MMRQRELLFYSNTSECCNDLFNRLSHQPKFKYCRSSCRGADCCGVRLRTEDTVDPVWLECDDETVRIISKKQLEEILAPQKQPKNSALTPYLLFYARQ
jgi:hypothetical protein